MSRPVIPDLPPPEDFQPSTPPSGFGAAPIQPRAVQRVDRLSDALNTFAQGFRQLGSGITATSEQEQREKLEKISAEAYADALKGEMNPELAGSSQTYFRFFTSNVGINSGNAAVSNIEADVAELGEGYIPMERLDGIISGRVQEQIDSHPYSQEPFFASAFGKTSSEKLIAIRQKIALQNNKAMLKEAESHLFVAATSALDSVTKGNPTAQEELADLGSQAMALKVANHPADRVDVTLADAVISDAIENNNESTLDMLEKPWPVSGTILVSNGKIASAVNAAREKIRTDKEHAESRADSRNDRRKKQAAEETWRSIVTEMAADPTKPVSKEKLFALELHSPGASANLVSLQTRASSLNHDPLYALSLLNQALDANNPPSAETIAEGLATYRLSPGEASHISETKARVSEAGEFFRSPQWAMNHQQFETASGDIAVAKIPNPTVFGGMMSVDVITPYELAEVRRQFAFGMLELQSDPKHRALNWLDRTAAEAKLQERLLAKIEVKRKALVEQQTSSVGKPADKPEEKPKPRWMVLQGHIERLKKDGTVPPDLAAEFGSEDRRTVENLIIKALNDALEGDDK